MKDVKDGVSYAESIDTKAKIRGSTGEQKQQPKAQTKQVKGDGGRGSFRSKE